MKNITTRPAGEGEGLEVIPSDVAKKVSKDTGSWSTLPKEPGLSRIKAEGGTAKETRNVDGDPDET